MRVFSGILIICIVFAGCSSKKKESLKAGVWRGVIELQGQQLPFNFAVMKDSAGNYSAFVKNADEHLLLDEVKTENDSIVFVMHIFDSELKVAVSGDSLKGFFIKNYEKNYRLPFKAAFNQNFRFAENISGNYPDFTGTYAVTFINTTDTTEAIGVFENKTDNIVTGTFLTLDGDYRYLEGNIIGNKMYLSTFDGNHAYLFTATYENDSTLSGEYWSGKTLHQAWTGKRNEKASLPDADSRTYLKKGYDKIDFSFPDVNGNIIHPSDEKYKNKVLILQLFGTWCPNCMDETRFLAPWYDQNKNRGVEIIGLAYEAKSDFNYASSRVKKMINKLGVNYDFVIAGTQDKKEASKTLPMLNAVNAFPTTIFIGKDGKVKWIHTGFAGPGTGKYYQQFIEQFNEKVNDLLKN